MNIIFMRHGEAEDNVSELLSSNLLRCSTLTQNGKQQVIDSANLLEQVDKIYVSPLIRTLQTAKIVAENQKNKIDIIIDDRIREINWGKYDG
ncbi:MAG: phosphoglycerate mutase family protein [Candidatus Saccharibacteria bacterium]|nr:phosphoglycerate mutase family protein [Candidatus Saccharibacteria bacterium]